MKYVVADKSLADQYGFNVFSHRTNKNNIILNEKEVMFASSLKGDSLAEKITQINGTIYERAEIKQLMNEGGWND